jgi:hypothetical protein
MAMLSLISKETSSLEFLREIDLFSALGNVNSIDDEIIIKGRHYVFSSLSYQVEAALYIPFEAREPIEKFDMVTLSGTKASSLNLGHREKVMGMSLEKNQYRFFRESLSTGNHRKPFMELDTWRPAIFKWGKPFKAASSGRLSTNHSQGCQNEFGTHTIIRNYFIITSKNTQLCLRKNP